MKREDIAFCLSLIGKPWVSGAQGPDAFDCWGLLRYTFKERRGVALSQYGGIKEIGPAKLLEIGVTELATNWNEIARPEHFCVVAMGRNVRVSHVGIWLDEGGGGVFHSQDGCGVVFQKRATLYQNGSQHFKFYTLKV